MGKSGQSKVNDTGEPVSLQKEKSKNQTDVEWGNDFNEKPKVNLKVGPVTERELFQFAKRSLLIIAFLFVVIATVKIINPINEGVKDVWGYASIALNTIVSLIFGFYFGSKQKS